MYPLIFELFLEMEYFIAKQGSIFDWQIYSCVLCSGFTFDYLFLTGPVQNSFLYKKERIYDLEINS